METQCATCGTPPLPGFDLPEGGAECSACEKTPGTCYACRRSISEEDWPRFTDSDGELFCEDCGNLCSDCEAWTEASEFKETTRGELVCDSCIRSHYYETPGGRVVHADHALRLWNGDTIDEADDADFTTCDDCECGVHIEDATSAEGSTYCPDCRNEHLEQCPVRTCREWFDRDNGTYARGFGNICPSCRDSDFYYCEGCEEMVHANLFDSDADRCDSCAEEEQEDSGGIYNYSTDVRRYLSHFSKEEDGFALGFELETDTDKCGIRESKIAGVVRDDLGRDYILPKRDGSVSGPEFVSAPASLKVHRERLGRVKWPEGLRSWDGQQCGFHVHICRNYFDDAHTDRFVEFFNDQSHRREIIKFAGRTTSYAKFLGPEDFSRVYTAAEQKVKFLTASKKKYERFQAVNLETGKPTYEVRIFKGTLKVERLLAYLEFVAAVARLTKFSNMDRTWGGLVRFVESGDEYPNLTTTFRRLNLLREAEPGQVESKPQKMPEPEEAAEERCHLCNFSEATHGLCDFCATANPGSIPPACVVADCRHCRPHRAARMTPACGDASCWLCELVPFAHCHLCGGPTQCPDAAGDLRVVCPACRDRYPRTLMPTCNEESCAICAELR